MNDYEGKIKCRIKNRFSSKVWMFNFREGTSLAGPSSLGSTHDLSQSCFVKYLLCMKYPRVYLIILSILIPNCRGVILRGW